MSLSSLPFWVILRSFNGVCYLLLLLGSPDKITKLYCLCSWFWTFFLIVQRDMSECNEWKTHRSEPKCVENMYTCDSILRWYISFYLYFFAIYKIIVIVVVVDFSTYNTSGTMLKCRKSFARAVSTNKDRKWKLIQVIWKFWSVKLVQFSCE